ncbi:MAG: cysteine--tRNA ligase [Puniceicoccales bacterium]|nr:cysteine--tRNA ligase [Puniceicoccales bacterium]
MKNVNKIVKNFQKFRRWGAAKLENAAKIVAFFGDKVGMAAVDTAKLYNTETRRMEAIAPGQPDGLLRIYCCGPTVYHYAHIGNFRTFLVQDVLRRLLLAMGYRLRFIRNITDVDDKTIRGAQRERTSLGAFTQKWTDIFHGDCDALNILRPDGEPRATEHIAEQIAMVEALIRKGHAYATADGSVYFRLSSFPVYGRLSGVDVGQLAPQANDTGETANLADEYGRDSVSDFALWKAHKAEDGDIFWESPWGKGRPGWHIECSAMSMKYLGETIDLHGGGIDLCFPHHENEIAQAECVTGKPFVRHWFHSEHLQVEGQKMSKSLGNLLTLMDLKGRGYAPDGVRYALLSGHYRQILNFTFSGLDAARSALQKLRTKVAQLRSTAEGNAADYSQKTETIPQKIATYRHFAAAIEALKNDLNIPKCLGEIFSVLNRTAAADRQFFEELRSIFFILGIEIFSDTDPNRAPSVPDAIAALAAQRWEAKQNKNFGEADRLRQVLAEKGWDVVDGKDSYDLEPNGR